MDAVIILVWITFKFPTVPHNVLHEALSHYGDGSVRELSVRYCREVEGPVFPVDQVRLGLNYLMFNHVAR